MAAVPPFEARLFGMTQREILAAPPHQKKIQNPEWEHPDIAIGIFINHSNLSL